jgi:hypothetical protein
LYPLKYTIGDKFLSLLTICPRFVGLAARPRAATLPHTPTVGVSPNGKAGGAPAWLLGGIMEHDAQPSHPPERAVCAPQSCGARLGRSPSRSVPADATLRFGDLADADTIGDLLDQLHNAVLKAAIRHPRK